MCRLFTVGFLLLAGTISDSFGNEQKKQESSECLKKCLTPMARLERSFKYVFNNFEKVCDLLESGAYCVRKCSQEDQRQYYQYTTFYRIHCVDYEEVCNDLCKGAHKVEKTASKEEKMKKECLTLECSTVCYFEELSEECPKAKNVLLKINLGQVHSMAQAVHPITMEKMEPECRNLHDRDHMKSKLLEGVAATVTVD